MHRCCESRTEGGCAGFGHGTRGPLDVRVSGSVQALEHGVGFPATQELDGVGVDIGNEEGGSATSTERAGFDLTEGWTLVPERLLPPSLGLFIPWACSRPLTMTLDTD